MKKTSQTSRARKPEPRKPDPPDPKRPEPPRHEPQDQKPQDQKPEDQKPEDQKPEEQKPQQPNPDTQKPSDPTRPPDGQRRNGSASAMLVIPLQPTTAAFWENQSIKVNGGEIAQAGVRNEVSVVIRNVGKLAALAVSVDFRWASPAFGLSNLFPIAVVDNLLIGPGREIPVTCQWIPRAENGVHECLMVMCKALNDMQGLQEWQPQVERRCAQHNVSVMPLLPGQTVKSSFEFANLLPMRALTQLMGSVEQVWLPTAQAGRFASGSSSSRFMSRFNPPFPAIRHRYFAMLSLG